MPNKHALLSASSSHRWLNCPPSARLCESYEDKHSDFAAEGTEAHTLCEFKLRKALDMEGNDPTEDLAWYNTEIRDGEPLGGKASAASDFATDADDDFLA